MAAISSSSSASPASRRAGDPNAGLGGRGDDASDLDEDRDDPAIGVVFTVSKPLCRLEILFFPRTSRCSSTSTWMVATIGGGGGGGEAREGTGRRDVADELDRDLLRRITGDGLDSISISSASDTTSSASNISGKLGARARRLTWGEASGSRIGLRGGCFACCVCFEGDEGFPGGMLKFLRMTPKCFRSACVYN